MLARLDTLSYAAIPVPAKLPTKQALYLLLLVAKTYTPLPCDDTDIGMPQAKLVHNLTQSLMEALRS